MPLRALVHLHVNFHHTHYHSLPGTMVSLQRYIRQISRAGLKEYFRQMMYIGDAKAGTLVGKDQCVFIPSYLSNACI